MQHRLLWLSEDERNGAYHLLLVKTLAEICFLAFIIFL